MLQGLVSILSSAYVEILILAVLLLFFIMMRRDPRLVVSGLRIMRTLLVILIFLYFMFIWASTVQPTLRSISVFGMFLVNLFMLYNLILARLERPYRDALAAMTAEPSRHELIHAIWHNGKKFYYLRYAWSSLFSGASPVHFLHTVATDRVRDDMKDTLRRYGVEQKMITLEMMAGYLKSEIACDQTMPADFQDLVLKSIDNFANHPYIQEKANEFLLLATERPEDLHFPEWVDKFEACVRTYKSKKPN
jgi:hypothetical protein